VDDLEAARKFYSEALGLDTSEQYGLLTSATRCVVLTSR